MKAMIVAAFLGLGLTFQACGGNPCEKLVKFYCEEKQDQNLCQMFTEKVNAGMTKESCEANLKQAR